MIMNKDIVNSLLELIQREIPLCERPFEKIGSKIGLRENDVIHIIRELKGKKIIREICGIFDSRRLGYASTLVAIAVEKSKIKKATALINSHPGVSHNYLRDNYFNLWFTLIAESEKTLHKTILKLVKLIGVEKYMVLPTLKEFKINVIFDLFNNNSLVVKESDSETTCNDTVSFKNAHYLYSGANNHIQKLKLSDLDKHIIVALQKSLPILKNPFDKIASQVGVSTSKLFDKIKFYKDNKLMRRYCAILYHKRIGMKANAMTVWQIDDKDIDYIGEKLASYKNITHCYQRPRFLNWNYSIYTMIHSKNEEDAKKLINELANNLGINKYLILFSTKELKKKRVKLFNDAFEKWNERYL